MTNIQMCLTYLRDIDFDRETLARARAELADVTQRANRLSVTSADIERAATLAWNEAIERSAQEAEAELRYSADGKADAERRGALDVARVFAGRIVAAKGVVMGIRALKRTT